jgi:hypothetical protein
MLRVLIAAAGLIACVGIVTLGWYLHRIWRDRRLLRLDPRILAEEGRLNRQAAERLILMGDQLGGNLQALEETRATLDDLLSDATVIMGLQREGVTALRNTLVSKIGETRETLGETPRPQIES